MNTTAVFKAFIEQLQTVSAPLRFRVVAIIALLRICRIGSAPTRHQFRPVVRTARPRSRPVLSSMTVRIPRCGSGQRTARLSPLPVPEKQARQRSGISGQAGG